MANGIRRWIDRMYWGKDNVACEECGRTVPAHEAIWRGRHPYCSIEHEAADAAEAASSAPGDDDDDESLLAAGRYVAAR